MSQFLAVFSGEDGAIDPSIVERIRDILARWPGDVTVDGAPGVALGISMAAPDRWRRQDRQPLVDARVEVALVTDCRLDNREALRAALNADQGTPDSALLVRGYERWGSDLPSHLTGDFAGVLWDGRKRVITAFRDPLGVKPLFYGQLGGRLIIASDVDLIVELGQPRPIVDERLVVEHLLRQYASVDRTFWNEIRRLPGGQLLSGTQHHLVRRRYWFPPTDLRFSSEQEVDDRLASLFRGSVERRLVADGPVFAHLSGGLDSSSIVCVANDICRGAGPGKPVLRALSERFPGLSCDEGPYISAVLAWTGIDGIAWDDQSSTTPDLENPDFAGPGMKTYRTSGTVRDVEITAEAGGHVLLSGEGGDQLGSCFEVVHDMISHQPLLFALETVVRSDLTMSQRKLRTRLMMRPLIPRLIRRWWGARRYLSGLPHWLSPRCHDLAHEIAESLYSRPDLAFPDAVRRGRWRDVNAPSLGLGLDLNHRGAAAQGVEVRYPFLDQDLVGAVLAVPARFWPRPTQNARIHRRALSEWIPPVVRDRRSKAEFGETRARQLRRSAASLRNILENGEWRAQPYVERDEARALLDRVSGSGSAARDWALWREVWGIGTLEAWLRVIFG